MNSLRCRGSLKPIALERVLLRELGQASGPFPFLVERAAFVFPSEDRRNSRPLALVSRVGFGSPALHEVDPNMEVETHGEISRFNRRTIWQAANHRSSTHQGWSHDVELRVRLRLGW